MLSRPDVLVLGGGGVLGEAWLMGVLAGIEDATGFDMRRCEYFVGTSAGSIVAAHLVAGRSPRRPSEVGTDIEAANSSVDGGLATAARRAARSAARWALAASAPVAPLALAASGRGGALARAALLSRVPRGPRTLSELRAHVERSGARFDGRLRVPAVDRRNGRRVVFGSPGAPNATVAQAVEASCTVPWLFAPVSIAGREYVDGGVWSPTNLDVAPAGRDTYVLCLNPTAGINGAHTLIAFARNVARSAVSIEALTLQRRGAIVQAFAPDIEAAAAMGADFMNPEPRRQVLATGYRQGLKLGGLAPVPDRARVTAS
jgi:NTE family protein